MVCMIDDVFRGKLQKHASCHPSCIKVSFFERNLKLHLERIMESHQLFALVAIPPYASSTQL